MIRTFGPFHLDTDTQTLFRGGQPVPVGRRAVALLQVLVERPGLPVSKDVLIEVAWGGLAVEESNLAVQIAALRKALGTESGGEHWIETLPRRGYRFVGPPVTRSESIGFPDGAATVDRGVAVQQPGTVRWRVGRAAPLEALEGLTQRMLVGERQV